jgi:putative ABC transport system permease protein
MIASEYEETARPPRFLKPTSAEFGVTLNKTMSQFWQDLRYAIRVLAKSPVVTAVAIVSLALGIGANTAIFGILNALFLRSLPVRDPQQLVAISTINPDGQNGKDSLSLPMFQEIRQRQHAFSGMFAWSGGGMSNFEANRVRYAAGLDTVSGDYFSTLGIQPLLGRLITPNDVALRGGSSARVAVLSYHCWQLRYNGDPEVIGKSIRVDGIPLTIVGVTPKSFAGLIIDGASDVTAPILFSGRETLREPGRLWLEVIGRLKPGATLQQARAEMKVLWPRVQAVTVPQEYDGGQRDRFFARRIEAESAATGNSFMRERLARPLTLLMGLVGLVLLIACVNLANLMLARVTGRTQELGIRTALGASSWRLIRQLLTESVTLSAMGASLGLVATFWTSHFLVNTMWFGYVSLALNVTPDFRVLGFTATVTVLTGVLFGLAPAWRATRTNPASALQQNQRTMHGGAGRFGKLLVSTQIALSLVLVVGATLFVGSLEKLYSVDRGFRRQGVLLMQLFPQAGREQIPNRTVYYHQLADALSQLPTVEAVSYSHMGPVLSYEYKIPVSAAGSSGAPFQAVEDLIGPGFFHLMGMRLVAGREFEWHDDEHTPRVVIVSESLARQLFPGDPAVGRKIDDRRDPDHKSMEIVGVVNSASLWVVQSHEPMAIYFPLMQEPAFNQSRIDIRTSGDPWAVAAQARRTLESMGHHYPLKTQTLEERTSMFLTDERVVAMLSAFFGGLALLLASVGLYGLMSYAVTRRTSEIGMRMALGAQRRDVLGLIIREVTWLALAGIAAGVPLALAASRLIAGMLFGLSPTDAAPIAFSTVILLGVAILAGYLPARRASRIDPMTALRSE